MSTPAERAGRVKRSQAQEARLAKRVGGTRNAGSGNGWRRKNDVRSGTLLWEMKRTDAKSITLKAADLEDVRRNSWLEDRRPVMHLELGGRRYVLLEEDDALELLGDAGLV